MHNSQNKKKLQIVLLVLVAVLTLSIGYASITSVNLIINGNGTTTANQENFKVYFTDSSITEGKGTVSIDEDDPTIGYFDITGLSKVGDYAEATYTVLNNSNGVGAQITLQLTNSNSDYFKVTETIEDDKLQAGEDTTATVKVEMIKTPLNDTVSTSVSATLKASPIEDADATGGSSASKVAGDPESFATDSWATIQKAVQNNNTSAYNVGDTKKVTINGTDYRVRIANKTTGEHCGDNDTEYSQTACGFVVEFVDIITEVQMNSTDTNLGGYPATLVYDYLKNTLYGQLPSDLQAAIKPTRVISGHGKNDSTNFTTTDKLYLLSAEEVYGIDDGENHFYDTAYGTSHQLEYYSNNEVTYSTRSSSGTNLDKAIKQYNSSNKWWWLRSAVSNSNYIFRSIPDDGDLNGSGADYYDCVAPAFRIG